MIEYSDWDVIQNLILAARWTVCLSLIALVFGGLFGMILLIARVSGSKVLNWTSTIYIELFQGTPLLMQLFLAFFGLGLMGINVSPWLAATSALVLWSSAFLAEIWRGSVRAVARGQWEASASLGMGFTEQLRYVILPQALRVALAPTVGFFVQIVKGTALTSIIGFVELSKAGSVITNITFEPFKVYGFVALIYFALCWPLSKASEILERKLNAVHSN